MKFQVELTREEVQALAVFKPELRKMIDDYDCSYNIYVHKIGELLGLLRFLSKHDHKQHINKLKTLKSLLCNYFFERNAKIFISDTQIADNTKFCKFISKLDSLYCAIDDINDYTVESEDVKDLFKEYNNEIMELLK